MQSRADEGRPDRPQGAKPRLLILTPRYPFPPRGGDKLRIFHLARMLAPRFDITLATFRDTDPPPLPPLGDDNPFLRVVTVPLPRWRSWLNCAAALFGDQPLQVAYYRSARFEALVEELLPEHDVLLVHLVRLAPYAARACVPRVLEMTDAISMNLQRARAYPNLRSLRSWVYRAEAGRVGRYERRIAPQFDLVSLISKVDLDHLFTPGDVRRERMRVIPNGVAPAPTVALGRTQDLVFLGNVHSLQNRDALRYFVDEILPKVRQREPAVRLRVIGPIAAREARRLGRQPGVLILGEVESIADAIDGAAAGVCPVRIGAGMQNKLLDYMAHGLPAITSPIGLEGLEATPDTHLLVATSTQEWVSQVLVVLSDIRATREMAARAQVLVREQYSWAARTVALSESIARLLTGFRGRTG